jgi:hypothetical protein
VAEQSQGSLRAQPSDNDGAAYNLWRAGPKKS